MDVLQCPECQLRFLNESELRQHISLDHPDFEWTPNDYEEIIKSAGRHRKNAPHTDQD